MKNVVKNGVSIAIADQDVIIENTQDVLELIVSARYNDAASGMVIRQESLPDNFFDLKTGFAGEVLQKFSNYQFKVAIVGDFSSYTSQSLKDFIYECNKGNLVFFKSDPDSAVEALTAKK